MPYTTATELATRYGPELLIRLTDRAEPAAGVMDQAVVEAAIAEADALIDGYLAKRYALPLSTTPSLIGTLSRQIAVHVLHPWQPDEKIEKDHAAALRQLQDLARGLITLPDAAAVSAETSGGGVRTNDRDRPMTEDSMKGFI